MASAYAMLMQVVTVGGFACRLVGWQVGKPADRWAYTSDRGDAAVE